ncbi:MULTISPECIES: hypothetical protein [Curtobacterium]|uniref:hypothetical protein n=1 Tax=Curtobacterium flaccumfaciens TaxID=2035 RepID=UPI003EE7FADB
MSQAVAQQKRNGTPVSVRRTGALVVTALSILGLSACAHNPTERATPTATRAEAQERTADVQRRIIDAFPAGSVGETRTGSWTLLDCSEDDVQSSIGADLTLTREVPVESTYDTISRELRSAGYDDERNTTSHRRRLVVTGPGNDQYFVSILNDSKRVQISSFSQCFPGSLTDG